MEEIQNQLESKIKELQKQLEECQKTKEEYLAGWQRSRADFLNYKKDEMERISNILKYGYEELILKILPILDNFERAEQHFYSENLNKQEKEKIDKIIQGFLQIKSQLNSFLKNLGVEEIEVKIGDNFDINFHEIIEEVESYGQTNKIVEIVEKGYKLWDKIIRPVKIKIGK